MSLFSGRVPSIHVRKDVELPYLGEIVPGVEIVWNVIRVVIGESAAESAYILIIERAVL